MKLISLIAKWFVMYASIDSYDKCKTIDITNDNDRLVICFNDYFERNYHKICYDGNYTDEFIYLRNNQTLKFFPFYNTESTFSMIYDDNFYIITNNQTDFELNFDVEFFDHLHCIDQENC